MATTPAPWPQQEYFRSLVDAKVAKGIPKEQQAKEAGIAETSFTTWYSGNRPPGIKTVKLLAAYYGVPVADLTDMPSEPVPGMEPDEMAKLTPAKRLVMRSLAQKLGSENVSDEAAEAYFRVIDSLIKAGKIRP
jgi:transcriptional regulator with XRE-family HTH domain